MHRMPQDVERDCALVPGLDSRDLIPCAPKASARRRGGTVQQKMCTRSLEHLFGPDPG